MDLRYPDFKKGQILKADDLNAIITLLKRMRITAGQSSGISLQESNTGTAIRVSFPPNRYVAITTTTITVRSGSTPGAGTVKLQLYSEPSNAWVDSGCFVDVLYFSSSPVGGIASGKYCWVEQDCDGNYVIVSVEC